jgi:hypothetical protein
MPKNLYFIEFFGVLWQTEINDPQGNYENERFRGI